QGQPRAAAAALAAWGDADGRLAGGAGLQRAGQPGGGAGGGLPRLPRADAATDLPQPAWSAVSDPAGADRLPGPLCRAGRLASGHRRVQRRGPSLALAGEPSACPLPDASATIPPRTVASHG